MEQTPEEIRLLNLQKKIFRLRRQGISWVDIAQEINKDSKTPLKVPKVQDLYNSYKIKQSAIASSTKNGRAEAKIVNEQFNADMQELIDNLKIKTQKHLKIADELLVEAYEEGNTRAYFKNLPVAISLFRTVLDQLNFLGKQVESINITQNNLILSETDIMNIVNKTWKQKEKDTGMSVHPGTGEIIYLDDSLKR